MFRKWLVSVVAAAVMAVGFWGCEGEETKPATPAKKPTTATKPKTEMKGMTAPESKPKTEAPATKKEEAPTKKTDKE